jgi:chemotaxis protein histidine kinase CheA
MQRARQEMYSDSDETNSSAEDDDELVYSSEDNDCGEDSDDSEVEPPHPIGFRSWGRTRFGLNPVPTETMERFKRQKGYLYPHGFEDGLDDWTSEDYQPKTQQYPPISSYIDPKTASMQSLVRYAAYDISKRARESEFDRPVEDDEMDKISQLFQAAAMIEDTTVRRLLASPQQQQQQLKSVPFVPEDMASVQREMDEIRRRMERDHLEAAQALKMIIRRNEQEAEKIIASERRRDEESEREEKAQRQKEEQKVAEDQEAEDKEKQKKAAKEELENEKIQRAQAKKDQQRQKVKDQSDAAEAAIAKDREYILKAEKLIGQLVQVRASVEPFENSKALSKRRLGMKKIINGKVNTLEISATTELLSLLVLENMLPVGLFAAGHINDDDDL